MPPAESNHGLAGRGGVLRADLEVVVPVALEQRGDLVAVGGQAGGGEQVGAVADALGADVGAVADEAAVGVGGGVDLPVEPAVGGAGRHLGEQVGVLHDLGQPVDLDGLDVGEALLAELLEVVRASVVRRRRLVLHDGDVRVRVHVLLEELVGVAEVVERRDGQFDRPVLRTGVGRRRTSGGDDGDGCGACDGGDRPGAS